MKRRHFLTGMLAASGALAMQTGFTAAGKATQPLRILILGGTGNIGPYHVRAAVDRGHDVSVFSRGKSRADLPDGVERLIGDRNNDLESIRDRDWDAVLDIATYGPEWVRSLGRTLAGRVKHYTFISTISVYDKPEENEITTENSPVLAYVGEADPYTVIGHRGDVYGSLKVLCEREAENQFPGRTLILRPGYIGGPGDTTQALSYWVVRASHGGWILAADDPATPVQFIDVRDMAEWTVRLIEKGTTGVFNTVGPTQPVTLEQVVEAACQAVPSRPAVTWVPSAWLAGRGDQEYWGTLFFWSRGVGHIMRMSNARAVERGFKSRPITATLADTLDWYRSLPAEQQASLTTGYKPDKDGAGFSPVTLTWEDYLDRERNVLAAWYGEKQRSG